ncbi:MAG: hypothetical protein K6T86_14870 [Pirellulales bacterium]|nr:hypothetical protein [Pirellulales bacterium]
MLTRLQEFCAWPERAARVDREAAVLRGVKILGLHSRNGRRYLPEALAAAAPLYEGARVNVDHPQGPAPQARCYRDRLGILRQVRAEADGLYGDLHYNPKHALAEQLLWDAEHAPQNVGLSHHVQARAAYRGGELVVEAILEVYSVDLVAEPAATRGLFEAAGGQDAAQPGPDGPKAVPAAHAALDLASERFAMELAELSVSQLLEARPDVREAVLREHVAATAEGELARLREEAEALRTEVAQLRQREAQRQAIAECRALALHLGLPPAAVSERFLEWLAAAPQEDRRALIEDRLEALRAARQSPPRSSGPLAAPLAATLEADARALAELLLG